MGRKIPIIYNDQKAKNKMAYRQTKVKMKFGLVCISEVLKSKGCGFRTMTRKSFNSLPRQDALIKLGEIILHNVNHTIKTIKYCAENNIAHYRISSSLMPLITDRSINISFGDLPNYKNIEDQLSKIDGVSEETGVSLSIHPDQYNQLASYSGDVVANTIRELNFQAWILDKMGLDQSPSVPMCLHVGCSPKDENPFDFTERFLHNLEKCSIGVRRRLVLENEDKGFWNAENLLKHFSYFPLVFDNLHFSCNNPCGVSPFETIKMFRDTWGEYIPVFHLSEGLPDKPRSHSDYISEIPQFVLDNWDCVWECEVKKKDLAILKMLNDGERIKTC